MIIKGVLKEELHNSLKMKRNYEKEMKKLPKGSLYAKRIKKHVYYYIILRHKGAVRFIYKGKIAKDQIAKYNKAKELKAKYRKLLSKIKQQIKFLKRSLRGKESV